MDKFRVQALIGALKDEADPHYQQQIKRVLGKKLEIIIGGCIKRGKLEEASKYEDLLSSYEI